MQLCFDGMLGVFPRNPQKKVDFTGNRGILRAYSSASASMILGVKNIKKWHRAVLQRT